YQDQQDLREREAERREEQEERYQEQAERSQDEGDEAFQLRMLEMGARPVTDGLAKIREAAPEGAGGRVLPVYRFANKDQLATRKLRSGEELSFEVPTLEEQGKRATRLGKLRQQAIEEARTQGAVDRAQQLAELEPEEQPTVNRYVLGKEGEYVPLYSTGKAGKPTGVSPPPGGPSQSEISRRTTAARQNVTDARAAELQSATRRREQEEKRLAAKSKEGEANEKLIPVEARIKELEEKRKKGKGLIWDTDLDDDEKAELDKLKNKRTALQAEITRHQNRQNLHRTRRDAIPVKGGSADDPLNLLSGAR
ncbi:MAG: hypothetical protein ACYSWU_01115, partial [Planctomycetota bacterium]